MAGREINFLREENNDWERSFQKASLGRWEIRQGWGFFPDGSVVKNLPANAGDAGSTPRLGRSPRVGTGHSLQCSSVEISIDRGARWAIVHGIVKSQTQLSIHTHPFPWSSIVHKWQANIHKYLERCHWCRRHFLIAHSGDSKFPWPTAMNII